MRRSSLQACQTPKILPCIPEWVGKHKKRVSKDFKKAKSLKVINIIMLYKKMSRRKITAKCLEGVGHFAVIFGHKKSPQGL